jgi:hypothetical protein
MISVRVVPFSPERIYMQSTSAGSAPTRNPSPLSGRIGRIFHRSPSRRIIPVETVKTRVDLYLSCYQTIPIEFRKILRLSLSQKVAQFSFEFHTILYQSIALETGNNFAFNSEEIRLSVRSQIHEYICGIKCNFAVSSRLIKNLRPNASSDHSEPKRLKIVY